MEHAFYHYDNGDTHLPPGFRFHPTDEELITSYLIKKVLDSNFTGRAIADVDLNKCEPWELPEKAKMGEKEWYFFSLRDRKYPTGLRTNRATEAGYWKATGKDREIYSSKTSCLVGMKKTLVFYRGRAPRGDKTNWVMHEYRLEGKFAYHYLSTSSKDEWVISRVFQKNGWVFQRNLSASGSSAGIGRTHPISPASLPPLLDTSPLSAADHTEKWSCDGESVGTAHAPCFSTIAAADFNPPHTSFDDCLPAADPQNHFPSLRNLRENLQVPFFFSAAPPPPMGAGPSSGGNWIDLLR